MLRVQAGCENCYIFVQRLGRLASLLLLFLVCSGAGLAQSDVHSQSDSFEVASVKQSGPGSHTMSMLNTPPRFVARAVTMTSLLEYAYGVKSFQLSGGPGWLSTEEYDVEARMPDETEKLSAEEQKRLMPVMVQALLKDRFGLKVHSEAKQLPVLRMVVAKSGMRVAEDKPTASYDASSGSSGVVSGRGVLVVGPGQLRGRSVTMDQLADQLTSSLSHTVINETGLEHVYDFKLGWTEDASNDPGSPESGLVTALKEQLGLELKGTKGPTKVIVVDQAHYPSEN